VKNNQQPALGKMEASLDRVSYQRLTDTVFHVISIVAKPVLDPVLKKVYNSAPTFGIQNGMPYAAEGHFYFWS
jgi:hypothetical protein